MAKRSLQLNLIPSSEFKPNFGGSALRGKRKTARPFTTNSPMHLSIKSDRFIFKKYQSRHSQLVISIAARLNVQLYDFQFNGNHVHIVARFYTRESYLAFVRELTGKMALLAKLGSSEFRRSALTEADRSKSTKCFPDRPFTRILKWGKDLQGMLRYLRLNELESAGLGRRNARILLNELLPPT